MRYESYIFYQHHVTLGRVYGVCLENFGPNASGWLEAVLAEPGTG
jgi:hypothetical protein